MADQGKTGFGLGGTQPAPTISEDQALAQAGDHTKLLQLIERHTRKLEEKYVEQAMEQPFPINIPGSATSYWQRIDYSNQPHNSFIVCVVAGTLNLWVGDYGNPPQAAVPNWGTYTAGANVQYFVALRGRVYIAVNPSTTVLLTASLIPLAN